jgi:hypothetical protein
MFNARNKMTSSDEIIILSIDNRKNRYRRRGLASACMYRLCSDLLSEGKSSACSMIIRKREAFTGHWVLGN